MGSGRVPRKPRPPVGSAAPGQAPPFLAPYHALIDTADVRGWSVALSFDDTMWELVVRDGKKIIARGKSTAEAPVCFIHMAAQARRGLEFGKRLTG